MTEIIEGHARDVTPQAVAMTVAPPQHAIQPYEAPTRDPLRTLGLMDMAEFDREVQVIKAGTDRMMKLQVELLRGPENGKPGIDYDTIPGTNKPSLLQPGAERLAMFHRLIPEHRQQLVITPNPDPAWPEEVAVHTQTFLHAGHLEGPIVGSAVASCSSYEDRYLYRSGERLCPKCGKAFIIKGNPKYAPRTHGRTGDVLPGYEQGGWLCWKKPEKGKDGCGATFQDNDRSITDQAVGKNFVENPRGLINTFTQMSAKRGFVGAIRHTLGITDIFTQDVEDMQDMQPRNVTPQPEADGDEPPFPGEAATVPAQQRQSAPRQQAAAKAEPKGTGATFEGPVIATPDGTRQTANGRVLNFAIKVGSSKHNVDLWDDLALSVLPLLKEGVAVGVDGERFEEDWPGRGEKPMKKVIKNVTRVVVDGREFRPAAKAEAAPAEAPSAPMFDPEAEAPAAPVRTLITGQKGGTADVFGQLEDAAWKSFPNGREGRWLYLEVAPEPGATFVKVAVSEKEALENGYIGDDDLPLWSIGTRLRVIGGWSNNGQMLTGTIITPA